MQLLYEDIVSFFSYINNKKVFFWGIGVAFSRLMQRHSFSQKYIEGYLDKNYVTLQNVCGKMVESPQILESFSEDNFIVVSCDGYSEISMQLEKWGYKKYIHYIDGVHLENSILEYKYTIEGKTFANSVSLKELDDIEREIRLQGINTREIRLSDLDINMFEKQFDFASFYLKDSNRDYWRKMYEYYFAYHFIGLEKFQVGDVYVDIGSSSTPWVYYLREQLNIEAYGVDLV